MMVAPLLEPDLKEVLTTLRQLFPPAGACLSNAQSQASAGAAPEMDSESEDDDLQGLHDGHLPDCGDSRFQSFAVWYPTHTASMHFSCALFENLGALQSDLGSTFSVGECLASQTIAHRVIISLSPSLSI